MNRIFTGRRIGASLALVMAVLLLGSLLGGCTKSRSGKQQTIYQTIASSPQFSILTAAVNKAGLKNALETRGEAGETLFAPNNDAFAAAGLKTAADLASIPDSTLTSILLYHVLGSSVPAGNIPLADNTPVTTLNGQPIYATRTSNGSVFVNGNAVIRANILCTNGIIHEIGHVLMPASGTIVQTAIADSNLSLLVAAVLRASQGSTNVAGVLSGVGPFTVFAPTNEAFVKAGFPSVQAINQADPNTLTSILTYHVIPGRIFSSDLSNNEQAATANGETVSILLANGPQVKGRGNSTPSNIIDPNIVTTNGVVHVIDQVLLP